MKKFLYKSLLNSEFIASEVEHDSLQTKHRDIFYY